MITTDIRPYEYYLLQPENAYGQKTLDTTLGTTGWLYMAIYPSSQSIQDNILYKDCTYVGLTYASAIDDTFVIQYGEEKLKVLYVNPQGRYKQVFLKKI